MTEGKGKKSSKGFMSRFKRNPPPPPKEQEKARVTCLGCGREVKGKMKDHKCRRR